MLLRELDTVVATAAAEEADEAFAVPFEAAVAFAADCTPAVGTGAVAARLVSSSGVSESFGCSAEKSSTEQFISFDHAVAAATIGTRNTYQPAVDRTELQMHSLLCIAPCINKKVVRPSYAVHSNAFCSASSLQGPITRASCSEG